MTVNGEDAAKLIKKSDNVNKHTPIVGMTAYDFSSTKYFSQILFKPLKKEKVIELIMKLTDSL